MGFFSSIGSAFGFGDGGAGDAANVQNAALFAANKRLQEGFDPTEQALQPFQEAGLGALPGLIQGSTAGGLDERLGEIFGGESFQNLVGERTRAAQGQLSSAGLFRSGQAVEDIANIPTELGFGIENLLAGREAGLAGQGFGAATTLGNFRQNLARGLSGLDVQSGQVGAQGILGGQQAQSAGIGNLLGAAGSFGTGALQGGLQGGIGSLLSGLSFSDPGLKTNVRKVDKLHDLDVYEWDWKPETKGTIVEHCPRTGFMSTEVKDKYPNHVYEFGGFDFIDYEGVLLEMEAA